MSTSLYTPLSLPNDKNSIRLLSLQGSPDKTSPIVANLHIAKLNDNPTFEALSYCWGPSENAEDAQINGETLSITPNLASALRALRSNNKTRVLWVDAICINQANNAEKNVQVLLMRRIYATSMRTTVWLGTSDKSTQEAFKLMQKESPKQRYGNVVNEVLRRPWWRRVWVVQEVAFAPTVTVQCGEDAIEWQHIIRHCSKLTRLRGLVDPDAPTGSRIFHPSFYPQALDVTRRKIQAGGRLSILEALRSFRVWDSTRGVDKIYGILGLLEDPDAIAVDYDKPVNDVFRDLAIHIVRTSQRLDVLQDCLPPEIPDLSGLNSWVPDWTDKEQDTGQDIEAYAAVEPFRASRDRPCGDVVVGQDGSLRVSAQFITTIAELSEGMPSPHDIREKVLPKGRILPRRRAFDLVDEMMKVPESWNAVACRCNGEHGTLQDKYPTNESMLEAVWNTLNRAPPFADLETARNFDKWLKMIELCHSANRKWQKHVAQRLPWPLVWLVIGPCFASFSMMLLFRTLTGDLALDQPQPPPTIGRSTWKLGRTENGLLGIFPAPTFVAPKAISSRVGDAVAILDGGARPYVLRKEGNRWRLIGDAYVHGIMHGAAFDASKCVAIELV